MRIREAERKELLPLHQQWIDSLVGILGFWTLNLVGEGNRVEVVVYPVVAFGGFIVLLGTIDLSSSGLADGLPHCI